MELNPPPSESLSGEGVSCSDKRNSYLTSVILLKPRSKLPQNAGNSISKMLEIANSISVV